MVTEDIAMRIATFRFGVIADLVTRPQYDWGERSKLIFEKTNRSWIIPNSARTHISVATIMKWMADYKKAGNRIEELLV